MFRQLMNAKYDAEIFFSLQDLDYHSDYLLLWSKEDTSKSDYQTLPRQGRTDFFSASENGLSDRYSRP